MGTEPTDHDLLRRYAEEGSEAAFAALVERHVDLVYAAAKRQTGDRHQAEDLTQCVFLVLSRKAGTLGRHVVVPGWLVTTTRNLAAALRRSEARRARREQRAARMKNDERDVEPQQLWPDLSPQLDEALAAVAEKTRTALVLRYLKGMTVREVATTLGIAEDAAKQRMSRGVEQLRTFFARRGVVLSAGAISSTMTACCVEAAPPGLAAAATAAGRRTETPPPQRYTLSAGTPPAACRRDEERHGKHRTSGKAFMTATDIVDELRKLGSDSYKKILLNHGIKEPVFGVKVAELKKFQKRLRKDYGLALDLYDTGIYDAMYLAGLIADETKMTKKDLRHWLAVTNCDALCGSAVAWVTAESAHGWDLAREWIESKKEPVATAGWETLASLAAVKDDADIDLSGFKQLLGRVEKTIHTQPNRVRYAMNGFVIAVGTYVRDLSNLASQTAERIGVVTVDVGDTSCKVPFAPDYIAKARKRAIFGKKRKTARC